LLLTRVTTPEVFTGWPANGLVLPSPWISMIVRSAGPSPPQVPSGDAVLRGTGAPVAKSPAFWSVSVQPLAARRSAVVFDGAGAGPVPSKKLAEP
jgi:hypothetical protein